MSTAVSGDGGDITLTANSAIIIDQFSLLDARSQFGGSGTVGMQAPTRFLKGTIVPLPQNPQLVTNLYSSKCVAGKDGHFSSFVNSKADAVPPSPGTYLASPFLPLSSTMVALDPADVPSEVSDTYPAAPILQVAAYSPPILFGQTTDQRDSCRP